jgi:hypothetical protein
MNKELKVKRHSSWRAFSIVHQGTRPEKRRAWRKLEGMA